MSETTNQVWQRLILVASSAWVLAEPPPREESFPTKELAAKQREPFLKLCGRAVEHHRRLLSWLLDASPGHGSLVIFQEPLPEGQVRASNESEQRIAKTAHEAAPLIAEITSTLTKQLIRPPGDQPRVRDLSWRHRVVLDATRFQAVTGWNPPTNDHPDYFVTIDFRLVRAVHGPSRWHVSVSVWSDPPLTHMPEDHRPLPLSLSHKKCLDHFTAVARKAEEWMEDLGREHSFLRVLGYWHMLPDFLVAVPTELAGDPGTYLTGPVSMEINALTQDFLRANSVADDTVAMSVLDGAHLTFRHMKISYHRFDPAGGAQDVTPNAAAADPQLTWERLPLYLIVPGSLGAQDDPRAREEAISSVIESLTDVEFFGAFTLEDVHRDMEAWRNHIEVYDAVAAQGSLLWDSLSTHLPIGRRSRFGKVHRIIELLHQTLLQGIADLNELRTLSQRCLAQVDQARADLVDRFNNELLQRPVQQSTLDIREAVTSTGAIAQLHAAATGLEREAERVVGAYRNVLDAAGMAFDERRAREGDEVQKAAAGLAAVLGTLAVIASLSALAPIITTTTATPAISQLFEWIATPTVLAATVGVSGLFALVSLTLFLYRVISLGHLGTHKFRKQYRGLPWPIRYFRPVGVWQFLRDAGTELLEFHLQQRGVLSGKARSFWAEHDKELAKKLARLWDDYAKLQVPPKEPRRGFGADLNNLRQRVSDWTLHSLIFTERAKRLHRYRLPQLTLLYRCISRLPSSYLTLPYISDGRPNIVSMAELRQVIANHLDDPYHSKMAWESAVVDRLDDELRQANPRDAKAALKEIDRHLAKAREDLATHRERKQASTPGHPNSAVA